MQDQRESELAARATVIATTALGAAAGFLLGCVFAIPLAEAHLRQYLERVALQNDASVREARDLLGKLQHSANPPCSEAELNYFRELVFRSDSLRDAGRIHEGSIECSATAGRPAQSIGQLKAGTQEPDGTVAYSNLVAIRDQGPQRAGIQQGDMFVVFGSNLPVVEGPLPIHLAVDSGESSPSDPGGMEPADSLTRQGDTLAARHCSAIPSSCVTASVSVDEARRGESAAVAGTTVTGGILGACLGILFCRLRRRSLSLDQQLRRAVARGELQVVYQPIVNLDDGKITGAEALARWTKPDGESVSPDVFIKVAEENGFVGMITKLVFHRAIAEFREVFHKMPEFRLNINIAAADLADPEFLPMIDAAVAEAKVRTSNLVLEVTESTTASREVAMESIRSLRERGYSIYIDDFGTGYSNLSYLLYLSVDTIKIDKAFTRAIGTEAVTVALLPQIIAMARSLNLGVVVEGIESERQADYFSTDNLRIYGQGWLYGRPVPAAEFFQLLGLTGDQPSAIADTIDAIPASQWRRLGRGVENVVVQ
ncbi:MAG: EAL domain-containing protein [Terracidiphilus sp.]|jgi:sensor c-di-GMP phosphodiesterase-like protein